MSYQATLNKLGFYIFAYSEPHTNTHSHDFLELVYITSGKAKHVRDKCEQVVQKGDYLVIDYRSEHSYMALTDDFAIINCLFLPELIDASLIHCKSFSTVISNYQIKFESKNFLTNPSSSIFKDDDGSILLLLENMIDEFLKSEPGFLQIIRSCLIELLVLTMRKIYITPAENEDNSIMNYVLEYIVKNYSEDITLEKLCRKFGYSLPYMSLKFKKHFGITYANFLQKVRIEQSIRALANTKDSVESIARSVGYNDIKSFYAVFKKHTGTTPIDFRNKNH